MSCIPGPHRYEYPPLPPETSVEIDASDNPSQDGLATNESIIISDGLSIVNSQLLDNY